ncbi:MAG: Hsp70 family protein [Bacteroidota bacterium]
MADYIVGIDLGTTHCVLAYTEANPEGDPTPPRLLDLPQVVSAGQVQSRPLLPSFLLLPGPHDVPPGSLALPWNGELDYAVGTFARERGAELPARLVGSAKSWLSHAGVDRTAPILPWDAPDDARRASPVEAAQRYLEHLRDAWNHHMAVQGQPTRLEDQTIFLTVPASFDPVARELTVQAARAAGLQYLTLLEEPQAAFYAWIAAHPDTWRDAIEVGESILVCDVGGGTTDFSLIEVVEEGGALDLRRVAVGRHILLGGDNMDLTLAYALRAKLAQQGTNLDTWQFRGLAHQCRAAKERLLNTPDLDAEPISILSRGSSLIGGTIRTELTRAEVEQVLVGGFFPQTEFHEHPQRKARVGVREMGLPYEADPAITRHLAQFLSAQGDGVAFPSVVLFNGGVMKAEILRREILQALRRWSGHPDLRELPPADLDQAVALGGATYGTARQGQGIRIKAGTARTYYIGV